MWLVDHDPTASGSNLSANRLIRVFILILKKH